MRPPEIPGRPDGNVTKLLLSWQEALQNFVITACPGNGPRRRGAPCPSVQTVGNESEGGAGPPLNPCDRRHLPRRGRAAVLSPAAPPPTGRAAPFPRAVRPCARGVLMVLAGALALAAVVWPAAARAAAPVITSATEIAVDEGTDLGGDPDRDGRRHGQSDLVDSGGHGRRGGR